MHIPPPPKGEVTNRPLIPWLLGPTAGGKTALVVPSDLGFGLARISQGGHFPSDVLFAGFASYYSTALACALSRGLGRLGPQPDGN